MKKIQEYMKRFFLWLLSGFLFFLSCSKKEMNYYNVKGEVFGTFYSITYGAESPLIDEESLLPVFDQVNKSLSVFDSMSVISRINRNDSSVVLDSLFIHVFEKGQEISKKTGGAFDMTVAPLVNCWGFGFKKSDSVTSVMVDSIRRFVGYEKVSLKQGKIEKMDPRTLLDASAIAKGYSCDIVANFIRSKGVENYMVEIGGEIVVSGKNRLGEDWRVGITRPTDDNSITHPDFQSIIVFSNRGLATSGNYRQFYYKNGKRYSHTINPHTGYPEEKNLLSATVISADCMTADAFATAFMVMGLDSAYAYSQSHQDSLATYFIYVDEQNNLKEKYNDSFGQYLVK